MLVSFGTDVRVALEFFHTDALCDGLHFLEILRVGSRHPVKPSPMQMK
jgi:hypothetical protein